MTLRCSANDRCLYIDRADAMQDELVDQYDRYGIYGGRWHEDCWERFGYGDFVFDPSYAGERLEEDDW